MYGLCDYQKKFFKLHHIPKTLILMHKFRRGCILYAHLLNPSVRLNIYVSYSSVMSFPQFFIKINTCRDSYLVRYCFHKIRICHDPVSLRSWIKVKVTYSVWTRSLVGDIYSSWTVLIWIYILLKLFLKH